MDALLIGRNYNLAWSLPQLLVRAGFQVDAISCSPIMKSCRFIRECDLVPTDQSLIPAIAKRMKQNYHWTIITEDGVLSEILTSNLLTEEKLKLLPVLSQNHFSHLFSKIGLSKILSAAGVHTPPFFVVHNFQETLAAADRLGYPVLLKQDASSGGFGIIECNSVSDLINKIPKTFHSPQLLQKKISGVELDLSALFLQGELVHFSYSKIEKSVRKFGPSSLRSYKPLHRVEESIFRELMQIGKALGANGFTNISCIDSEGNRFYFEVDMRPNVWVEFSRFFGEDPALRITKWFSRKEELRYPVDPQAGQPSEISIPYFLRLPFTDLLCNRYKVWKFIPKDDPKLIRNLLKKSFFSFRFMKSLIPSKYHSLLRKIRDRY